MTRGVVHTDDADVLVDSKVSERSSFASALFNTSSVSSTAASPTREIQMNLLSSYDFDAGGASEGHGGASGSEGTVSPNATAASTTPLLPAAAGAVPADTFYERRVRQIDYRKDLNEIPRDTPYTCVLPLNYLWCPTELRSVRVPEAAFLPRHVEKVQQTRPYIKPAPNALRVAAGALRRGLHGFATHPGLSALVAQINDGNFVQGCVGLANAGNTCFMNSVLQCLSHTPQLRDYYLTERFFHHINDDNPVGSSGKVATSFYELLRKMWHAGSSQLPYYIKCFAPLDFKRSITSFFQNYAYNQQHDAHEFLVFLLDGLHEDCNRVVKKPYIESPDSDDEGAPGTAAKRYSDEKLRELSRIAWQNQIARNKSVVHDLFYFQFKSLTSCDECGKESYLFDPVSCIQVPVLNEAMEHLMVQVRYFPSDLTQPEVHLRLCLKKHGTASQITRDVAKMLTTQHADPCADLDEGRNSSNDASDDDAERDQPTGSRVITMQMYEATADQDLVHIKETEVLSHHFIDTSSLHSPSYRYGHTSPPRGEDDHYIPVVHVYEHDPVPTLAPPKKVGERPEENPCLVLRVMHLVIDPSESGSETDSEEGNPDDSDDDGSGPYVSHTSLVTLTRGATNLDLLEILKEEGLRAWGWEEEGEGGGADGGVVPFIDTIYGPKAGHGTMRWDLRTLDLRSIFDLLCEVQRNRATGKRIESDVLSPKTLSIAVCWQGRRCSTGLPCPLQPVVRPAALVHASATQTTQRFSKARVVSLEQCLRQHNQTEQLDSTSSWYCSRCQKPQCAYRSLSIFSLPQHFVVHLKKNYLTPFGVWRKVDMDVTYPLRGLDVAPYVDDAVRDHIGCTLYDMYGAVCHYGTENMGHYTAIVYSEEAQSWMHFNDEAVTPVTEEEALEMPVYLLFYKRRSE